MKITRSALTAALITAALLLFAGAILPDAFAYESKTDRSNNVRVDVKPLQLEPGQPARFEVRMNTHSVILSQDMQAASTLEDSEGNTYQSTGWQGSPPGGHHRSGTLEFPSLVGTPKSIKLVLRDAADGPFRVFEWPLKQ
jgi:hypothetical protein